MMKIGVESYGSFGDCCLLTPFIRDLSEKHGTAIDIAVHKKFADAFLNLPFINNIIQINRINDGVKMFKALKYDLYFNATQGSYFRNNSGMFSLLDVPDKLSSIMRVHITDRRPVFIPTKTELKVTENEKFDLAIESEYNSGQSWSKDQDIMMVLRAFKNKRILWCSKSEPPVEGLHRFNTRRETIAALINVKHFFCVGSGIFCASLSKYRPENSYVLWSDDYFRYIQRFKERGWDSTITWIEDSEDLSSCLNRLRIQGFLN